MLIEVLDSYRFHVSNSVLVDDLDLKVGQVNDETLVDLLDAFPHECVSLVLVHV